jgi:hypothetical protein
VKTFDYNVSPVQWLKTGALLLAGHDEWTSNGGDFSECSETVTIAFDAEHKVSIQLGISAGVLETK